MQLIVNLLHVYLVLACDKRKSFAVCIRHLSAVEVGSFVRLSVRVRAHVLSSLWVPQRHTGSEHTWLMYVFLMFYVISKKSRTSTPQPLLPAPAQAWEELQLQDIQQWCENVSEEEFRS